MPTHADRVRKKSRKNAAGKPTRSSATGSSGRSATMHSLDAILANSPVADAGYNPAEDARREQLRRKAVRRMPAAALKEVGPDKLDLEASLRSTQLSRDLSSIRAHHGVLRDQATTRGKEITASIRSFAKGSDDQKNAIAASRQVTSDVQDINNQMQSALDTRSGEQKNVKNSANMSWVDRHEAVMAAAKAADPLMRTLAAGHDLSATHERAADARTQDGTLKGGRVWKKQGGKELAFHDASASTPFAVSGEDEFRNQPDPAKGSAPPLPILANPNNNVRGPAEALRSTEGGWGEADVSPLGKERDAVRLLHTHPDSHAYPRENPKRSPSSKPVAAPAPSPVDSPFHLSVDHYETAMPISPLPAAFRRTRMPAYETGNGKPSSFRQYQDAQPKQKLRAKIAAARNKRKGGGQP